MKSFAFLLVTVWAGSALAQQQAPTGVPVDAGTPPGLANNPISALLGGLLEHNYVNYFAFGDGIYDNFSAPPGPNINSFGLMFGGGVNAMHTFHNGSVGVAYRGDYRDYFGSNTVPSGTDQSLNVYYNQRLSRRWSLWNSESAGTNTYGSGSYYSIQPSSVNASVTNPFSSRDTFLSAGVGLNYQQTARLSYQLGADFFLSRYNYVGAFGSTGGTAWVGASYRLTARTTFGGTLSYSDFLYQGIAGKSKMESAFLTVSHAFSPRWQVSGSGGITKTFSAGTIVIPFQTTIANQLITGYLTGPYSNVSTTPYFQGSVTRILRGSSVTASGGESVIPGNGFYLASRDIFFNGSYARRLLRSTLSTALVFNRMSTVSNTASNYDSTGFTASYGCTLGSHIGANLYYLYLHYGTIGAYGGRNENQFGFGFTFSSRNVPVTPF